MEMKSLTIGGKTYDEFNPAAAAMNKKAGQNRRYTCWQY